MKVRKVALKRPKLESMAKNNEEPELDDEGDENMDMGEIIQEVEEEDFDNNDFPIDQGEERAIIESKVDEKKWLLECERVAAKLKFNIKSDAKEWRFHCDQIKSFSENMKKQTPEGRLRLERMSDDLGKVLERLSKREKSINVNLNEIGEEYRKRAEELKSYDTRYKNLNNSVRDLGEKYRTISEKLDVIQSKTSEHGNSFTDSSPIVKIKGALQKLKNEIKNMDLRIGVLNHSVTQHKTKENNGDENMNEQFQNFDEMVELQ